MTSRPPYSRAFCSRMRLLSRNVVAVLRYDSGTHRTSAVRYVSHITRGIPCRAASAITASTASANEKLMSL